MSHVPLLNRAHNAALQFLGSLPDRPVAPPTSFSTLRSSLGGALPEQPGDPLESLASLIRNAETGLVAAPGPRYFGFVTGGSFPVAVAADWLVSAWDQNAALHVMSPAVSAIEDVTASWILTLLSLPATASVGFVTGAHTANVTALAAARHEMLRRSGWDVEARGLQGAPRLTVLAGADAHSSIPAACRFIGLGADTIIRVASDEQGRMRADALEDALQRSSGARIVCAQAGNVNTGACDPFEDIVTVGHAHDAWVHVDGAFGLWAAVSPSRRRLVAGVDGADSWTTDAHKWLNVPYDSGIVVVRNAAAHRAAMSQTAAYLIPGTGEQRDGMDWVPEASRRARVVPIYAVIRSLGREGLAELVDRCSNLAARLAGRLRNTPGVAILNDVVLNQVLVRFNGPGGANVTPQAIEAIQRDGTCWCGGTVWNGESAMRVSVSNWRTDESDIDRSVEAMVSATRQLRAGNN